MDFSGRTVIVTGAAGFLGQAVAQAFDDAGANTVLVDVDATKLQSRYPAASERRLLTAADLLERNGGQRAIAAAVDRFERVDALCNIAGGFRMGEAVHETSDQTWDFLFSINVRTMLNMVRAAVPVMLAQGGGKIVNVGAFAAQKGASMMGAYCATKSVVIRLTESMAAELRDKNINVNCVLPTVIDTPVNRADMPDADPSKWVAPRDLAQTILFLCSDAANAIHGAALPVAGRS